MTAAYRLRGIGWFISGVIVVLACYLVSLQVAAERKHVEDMARAINRAHRDIRQLETEFGTRANLAQLERWNGEILALAAPSAEQFVPDEAALAQADFVTGPTVHGPVRQAAMVVPSAPPAMASPAAPAAPVIIPAVVPPAVAPVGPPPATNAASAPVASAVPRTIMASVTVLSPRRAASPAAAPRARTVALLDRNRLRENRLADLIKDIPLDAGSAR